MKILVQILFLLPVWVELGLAQISNYNSQNYVRLQWENDIFALRRNELTDRYFTNGIRIDIAGKYLQKLPLSKLLLRFKNPTDELYGLSIGQNMYTPIDLTKTEVDSLDRPYAGWLYISRSLISNDAMKGQRLTSELDIGVIGEASFARQTQIWFHKNVVPSTIPQGWGNQIRNDLGINYYVKFEKRFIPQVHQNLDIIQSVEGNVGFVSNFVGLGTLIRVGFLNDYFQNAMGLYDQSDVVNVGELRKFYRKEMITKKERMQSPLLNQTFIAIEDLNQKKAKIVEALAANFWNDSLKKDLDSIIVWTASDIYDKIDSNIIKQNLDSLQSYFEYELKSKQEKKSRTEKIKKPTTPKEARIVRIERVLNKRITRAFYEKTEASLGEVIEHKAKRKFQAYFFLNPVFRAVFDNSFLQGGIFQSRKNVYTISADRLERFYANVEYGIAISYGKLQLGYSQLFRTKEFKEAFNQQWGKIMLTVGW
ncbi:MAG: lipid A deacylase LpxR family protein [Microscillaceae bacterium]|nr:lipid A deacylase LpxR family protein [Microscillaceae bacterium]